MKQKANQPDTATNKEHSARARPKRRIDGATIAEIAKLCAKQLTESEACRQLGIKPRQWFNWKDKHNRAEMFAELLEAFRADRIDQLISRIEKSAEGEGLKQPDWRAAQYLLSVVDRKRFSQSAPANEQPTMPPQVNVQVIAELSRLVFGEAEVNPAPPPKQIAGNPVA